MAAGHLAAAVRAMSRDARTTPEAARDRCVFESERFSRLLTQAGVHHVLVVGAQTVEWGEHKVLLQAHTAVRVGRKVYDWTARQFDPEAPVPEVMSAAVWRQRWPDFASERGSETVP